MLFRKALRSISGRVVRAYPQISQISQITQNLHPVNRVREFQSEGSGESNRRCERSEDLRITSRSAFLLSAERSIPQLKRCTKGAHQALAQSRARDPSSCPEASPAVQASTDS